MATMAKKLSENQATVSVIRGGRRRGITDAELAESIRTAYSLWKRIKELEEGLALAKALIVWRAEALKEEGATVTLEAGGVRCTVTMRHEALVPEENVPALRKALGRRFRDLVRTRVQHTATSRLVDEATEEALSLIRLRRLSPQFRWSVNDSETKG